MSAVETHSFQAEVQQLLNLMIHSLYSNKEIFLRELVSNASDALDKLRFEELTNRNVKSSSKEAGVRITCVPDSNLLRIEDNGIGMTRDEMIANLGTIASSGTRKFLEQLSEEKRKDANLIGQFGVGFYAAFMVASKVRVESVSAKEGESAEAVVWESAGDGSYTLSPGTRTERGTVIELTLKDEEKEFADEWRVKGIVRKYSNYVTYPIYLETADDGETRLNQTTPVWARNKRENKPEDYTELYKQISHDFGEPLFHEHMSVEGLNSFNAVVFVPKAPPFDLNQRDAHGLHLYVKRVSIQEKCKELLPEYLRFVSGVVETDELPLNVSREILQQNAKLPAIKKAIVKKLLGRLDTLSREQPEQYTSFYETFGAILKEGFHFDPENQENLAKLARFKSTRTGREGWVSLKEYVERKAEGQNEIYFLSGPSYDAVAKSPHLEALVARDVEVLFFTDAIDEWMTMDYPKHGGLALKSIAKGDLDLRGVGKEPAETKEEVPAEELAGLLSTFRTRLGAEVKDVKSSRRLLESPVCLVSDEYALSAHMERLMKATSKEFAGSKRTLEVNPSHPLIRNLSHLKSTGASDEVLQEWVDVLYETALLSEGSTVKDPGAFAKRLTRIMEQASANPQN